MPHASLKLVPGVDQNRTPALNEAAISFSNLIRFVPDRQGLALPQKLGGWTRYFNEPMTAIVRALWAWADTNSSEYLGVGAEDGLYTIDGDTLASRQLANRSPQYYVANPTLSFSATSGSSEVEIDDTGSNVSNYDSIFLATHVSIGGLIMFGFYTCEASTASKYSIFAKNVIGLPVTATSTTTGGSVASFASTAGSSSITVTLANHGFSVGSTFPVLVSTTVSNLTLYGNYIVQEVTTNTFVISAENIAENSTSVSINDGKPQITYYIGQSAAPSSVGYGAGGYGAGGYGTGVTSGSVSYDTTAASCVGTTATVTFSGNFKTPIGALVTISGVTPSGYNGTWVVTASTDGATSTVSFTVPSTLGVQTVAGSIAILIRRAYITTAASCVGTTATVTISGSIFIPVGSTVQIFGVTPSGYNTSTNNSWLVTASTVGSSTSTVSFTVPSALGVQTVAGILSINSWGFGAATDWSLDNWGEYLIANPRGEEIFFWNPTGGSAYANVVPNAPKVNEGCFVAMPERQIIAYGSTFNGIQDPLLIRWCDIANFTSWIGTVANQAGSFRIPKGSRIVGGLQGPQQGLIWTDLGVWSMQYINLPLVWSFNEVGTGCGLIGQKAAATLAGSVYWMSQSQFYTLGGGGVQPIPCPIWDVIFQDIDFSYSQNIRCATNARFSEVVWYYPTTGSGGVPTKYVKFNANIGSWDFGTLTRTAWIDQSVLGAPIGASGDNLIFQHETSTDADGQAINAYIQTGWFALDEADLKTFVDQVWPDMKWGYYGGEQSANVLITFYTADYASQTPRVYGPYTVTEATTFVTPRLRGRLVSIRVESNDVGSFWRLGNIRYRLQPDGKF